MPHTLRLAPTAMVCAQEKYLVCAQRYVLSVQRGVCCVCTGEVTCLCTRVCVVCVQEKCLVCAQECVLCVHRRKCFTDGVIRLLKSPARSLGTNNNACWWRLQLSRHPPQLGEPSTGVTNAPPTTHGTISPHLAAPTHGVSWPPQPYLPLSILYCKLYLRPRSESGHPPLTSPAIPVEPHCLFSQQSPHNQPTPNSPLMYGVIRLPAGESLTATLPVLKKLNPSIVEWNLELEPHMHAMQPLALTACGLTWCRPQTLGSQPPFVAYTCLSFSLHTFLCLDLKLHVHMCMYRVHVILSGMEVKQCYLW